MIELKSVPWHDVDIVWPKMEKYAEQAVEHSRGTLTTDAIKQEIADRSMQAMVAVDEDNNIVGVLITEVHKAVSGLNYLHVVALAGERFDEWREHANDLLKNWAYSLDAPFVSMNGRRGWIKRLADLGWREDTVVMTMDLRS